MEDLVKFKKDLWKKLEEERKQSNDCTSKKLSEKIGIGENYLSAIVNGRKDPSFDNFLLYLHFAGFDLNQLASLKAKTPKRENGKAELIQNKLFQLIQKLHDEKTLESLTTLVEKLIEKK